MSTTPRILIIEDDEFLRTLAMNKIQSAGFLVDVAADGAVGYQKYTASKPDLLLLDLMLPTMDGFQILAQMKTENILEPSKIVVFSNLGSEEDIKRVLEFGVKNYIVKSSFTLDQLVQKIREILGFPAV
jgi:DNA-binding response OmpR family regulator